MVRRPAFWEGVNAVLLLDIFGLGGATVSPEMEIALKAGKAMAQRFREQEMAWAIEAVQGSAG